MQKISELLWEPDDDWRERANITKYIDWLESNKGLEFSNYQELWNWSVRNIEEFWESIALYFSVRFAKPYTRIIDSRRMPGAKWFVGASLNYAEHVLKDKGDGTAVIYVGEQNQSELSWRELRERTFSLATYLRNNGVNSGDRIVSYIQNIPEAIIAFLACSSIGAIWSSCSPDFGIPSVLNRFKQIEPKVLIASDGYYYNGKFYDRSDTISKISRELPTLERVIIIPSRGETELKGAVLWDDAISEKGEESYKYVDFSHPLWILYSSGTTGLPKAIVHGHGGILVEHLKALSLHNDIKRDDRFFWFTTTGWMMWNYLLSGLLFGTTIVLYDGSPSFPNMNALWDIAERVGITFLGVSAPYIGSCMKAGIDPRSTHKLNALRGIGSTGSPLSPDGFRWVYKHIKDDLWLASISGGTDLCTAFVGGCPILPVYAGELQCRYLGASVEAFDENGKRVYDSVGELVITEPMPSMPLYFWGDKDGRRYLESYFDLFQGVWRHGDWIEIRHDGRCIIYGRSDATLKRMGVRIGTSEIYSVVESIPEITDSLIISVEGISGGAYMPLFVVLREGVRLDDTLKAKIIDKIRNDLSPRYVPDEIFAVPSIPRTLNGKKVEVPVKKIFMGVEPEKAFNRDSLINPDSMDYFIRLYKEILGRK